MPEGFLDHLYFVDEERLDDYIVRLGIPDTTTDKTKKLETEFSITGPKVKFAQDEALRKLDVHTRIKRLQDGLTAASKVATSRPLDRWEKIEFVYEEFSAFRIAVPSTAEKDQDFPAFSFWISPGEDKKGMLCLLENCRVDDDAPFDFSRCSTYTVLQSLVHFARKEINSSILANVLSQKPHPNPNAQVDETHPPSLFHEYYTVENYLYDFVTDPVALLRRWGAIVSDAKLVRSLYRIREFGPESAHGWNKMTTFGYPIYVYDAKAVI